MLARKLWKARDYAIRMHGDQRYGAKPYSFHLDSVRGVAFEFGIIDEDILVSTLLHDTVEDTEATREDIEHRFGPRVASLVWAVTNVSYHPETGKKLNRKQKGIFTYPKITGTEGAVALKLCDRVANVRSCWVEAQHQDANRRNKSLLGMYKGEYGAFRKALSPHQQDDITERLWEELDRLLVWEP